MEKVECECRCGFAFTLPLDKMVCALCPKCGNFELKVTVEEPIISTRIGDSPMPQEMREILRKKGV